MKEQEAKELAKAVNGTAYQSGGDIWAVEIKNENYILILGLGGWFLLDETNGDFIQESI
jgi:hypothetical protein